MTSINTIKANGLQFAYLEAGKGPLVLLLHGFPDTAHTFEALLPILAAEGYHAVAPFQRGYFPTEIPADADYSAIKLGQDALALIEVFGEKKAVVVGHDWGAQAAYAAANLQPERLTKMVTSAIPHPSVFEKANFKAIFRARHVIFFQFGSLSESLTRRNNFAYIETLYRRWSPNWRVPENHLQQVKEAFADPNRLKAALGYYKSFMKTQADKSKMEIILRRTSVPALTFGGTADGALDIAEFDHAQKGFTGYYEFIPVKGAGHFIHQEASQLFTEKLLAFLARND